MTSMTVQTSGATPVADSVAKKALGPGGGGVAGMSPQPSARVKRDLFGG